MKCTRGELYCVTYLKTCIATPESYHSTLPRDDINKAYKQLAVQLHPDKNLAPGSDEAFKTLAKAREDLLRTR